MGVKDEAADGQNTLPLHFFVSKSGSSLGIMQAPRPAQTMSRNGHAVMEMVSGLSHFAC